MPSVLVTGATGFVGQHLVEALKNENRNIICMIRSQDIPPHLQHPNIRVYHADLMHPDQLTMNLEDVETVFHIAGHATLRTNNKEILAVNNQGTQNLLDACAKAKKLKKFIYISSLTAVAQPKGQKQQKPVDDACTHVPDTAYGCSKRAGEDNVRNACEKTNVPYVILRPALIYGPNSRSDAGLLAMHQAAQQGALISRFNWPGTVSLIYIQDLIKICLTVEKSTMANNNTYLVSDGSPITFGALFQQLSQRNKQWPMPKYLCKIATKAYDVCDRLLSISSVIPAYMLALMGPALACQSQRLQQDLQFQPAYPLSSGLSQTLGN